MSDIEMMIQCRLAEQKRLYNLTLKEFDRTHTARKIIMTEILREEVSWMNLTNTKEKKNG